MGDYTPSGRDRAEREAETAEIDDGTAQEPPVKRSTSGTKWSEEDYVAAGKGRLVLRIDQTDLDKLDAIAAASDRSRSAVVAAWIREWGDGDATET